MEVVIYFFSAFILSALGSVPPGLITLSIVQRTITSGKKAGLLVALGASLPEFIYAYVALVSLHFFQDNFRIEQSIQGFAIIVFLALGAYYLLKKSKPPTLQQEKKTKQHNLIRGLLAGTLNILIIPFWIFIATWLASYGFEFSSPFITVVFCLGAALGALLVFWLYAILGHFLLSRLGDVVRYSNKVIGLIFFLLGIYQFIECW